MSYNVTIGSQNDVSVSLNSTTFRVSIEQLAQAEIDSQVAAAQTARSGAETAQTDAESARDQAQSARDTANDHKLAAEAAATSATNTAASLTGFDLDAIAASKADTAVDVFVYDTSKDSDGGAWRKRTQGTSWYNETLNTATRGSRREFPAVAVIVAEADKVTIYDGDDPALPMWMVFEANSTPVSNPQNAVLISVTFPPNAVTMKDGILACCGYYFHRINMVSEQQNLWGASSYTRPVTIADRNTPVLWLSTGGAIPPIVSVNVNDVAMTVLPDAPIDPATGLPVPTIAAATDGGVSVIKDDGTVVDITTSNATYTYAHHVHFDQLGRLGIAYGNSINSAFTYYYRYDEIPPSDTVITLNTKTATGLNPSYFATSNTLSFSSLNTYLVGAAEGDTSVPIYALSEDAVGNLYGINFLSGDDMVNYITSSYQSGWQNGDIKGAFLSDTDDTDLVESGDVIPNGAFDTSGFWKSGTTLGSNVTSLSGGVLTVSVDTTQNAAIALEDTLTSADTVDLSFDISSAGNVICNVYLVPAGEGYDSANSQTIATFGPSSLSGSLSATGVSVTGVDKYDLIIREATGVSGRSISISNLVLEVDRPFVRDADRSVNNDGLIINGTVTRSPVATGADLVAYSGFSSSNYLSQPYNADLDFGTGDFCVMGWVKGTAATDTFVSRAAHSGSFSGAAFILDANGSAQPRFRITDDGFSTEDKVEDTSALTDDWTFLCGIVQSSVVYLYRDGELIGSTSVSNAATGVSNASATLRLGLRQDGLAPSNYSQALWRISATAPTAEQIEKIYNDEKVLFQENAQATLYGTSDAVTALAHDPVTDLLHVGTSDGRSVFQGLRRVDNTTDAVTTAISASNDLIAEQ